MIKPLTSLRFFFAFFVFLSHLSFVKSSNLIFNWFQRNIFFEGYLGVSFFFILSGFVLSYSYETKLKNQKITRRDFYVARLARIYPLHFITLFLAIPIVYLNSHNSLHIWSFLANLFLVQSFIPKEFFYFGFNAPAWSISDEMFFYLIFPFIILLLDKLKWMKAIFYIFIPLILIPGIILIPKNYQKAIFYVNPVIRSLDFILGILLYTLFKNKKFTDYFSTFKRASILEILSLLVFFIFFIFHNFLNRGFRFSIYYWIPMCVIIYTFAQNKGFLSKLLSNKTLVFLGEISFGFYMVHYLVITFGNVLRDKYFVNINEIVLCSIYFIITLILSYLSFIYFEKPMNTFIKKKLIKP
ncbi:acyltransferase [Epilithonimonas sp.]|uniref:acyltransferase family protein n=1 Tax=Epilithonimonas sp. TaxID=2894511 RepID=UPI00289B9AC5|nr:acyltransferase [Epilithonimonas sp.]